MVLTQWETLCGLFFCFFEKIVVPILTSGSLMGLPIPAVIIKAVDILKQKAESSTEQKGFNHV